MKKSDNFVDKHRTRCFAFYNTKRRHSALDRHTPGAVYFDPADQDLAA